MNNKTDNVDNSLYNAVETAIVSTLESQQPASGNKWKKRIVCATFLICVVILFCLNLVSTSISSILDTENLIGLFNFDPSLYLNYSTDTSNNSVY